jgi:hypothetical protein
MSGFMSTNRVWRLAWFAVLGGHEANAKINFIMALVITLT